MATLSRITTWSTGDTLTASQLNAEFNNILNDYNGNITNANVASGAAIAYSKLSLSGAITNADLAGSITDSKLAQITTASKVSGAALTSLASIPAGAGVIPAANLPAVSTAGVRLTKSAVQSINNSSWTAVTWDTESYDTDTMHDTSSNTSRITFTTGGVYVITFGAMWASNGTGLRAAAFAFNGGQREVQVTADSTSHPQGPMNLSVVRKVTAGDYVEVYVLQVSGGALDLQHNLSGEAIAQFAAQYLAAGA